MKIEIEIYKNQSIVYDDENDKFECDIELNDNTKSTNRSSLKDVRKEIDSFIKANFEFKPFRAFFVSSWGNTPFEAKTVSALRTDGKFVIDEGNGRKSYYGQKDMKNARLYDPEIMKEMESIEKEEDEFRKIMKERIEGLFKRLQPIDLPIYEL